MYPSPVLHIIWWEWQEISERREKVAFPTYLVFGRVSQKIAVLTSQGFTADPLIRLRKLIAQK